MAKKKSTAKSKKQEPKIEDPKILTNEQKQSTVDKFQKLKESEVMVLPDENIVNIPISGSFNKALEGLFFYMLEPYNASEVIHIMGMIKSDFKDVDDDKIPNGARALWTVLTLLSEIHWQANEQDKMEKTEAKVGNAIHGLLHGVSGATEKVAGISEILKKQSEIHKKAGTSETPKVEPTSTINEMKKKQD